MNDPFDGGMHLPDIFIFKPLYHEGERLAFACTVCHHTDVGGRVAGSNASDSTEIYAEGLRIAPMKLYDAGRAQQDHHDVHRKERARAGDGGRRPARAACRLPHRRAAVRRARRQVGPGDDQAADERDDRLFRAADARRAERAARRRVELRGLDRRRRHRCRQADPAVRDASARPATTWWSTGPGQARRCAAPSTTRSPIPSRRPTPASARCCRRASRTTRACSVRSRSSARRARSAMACCRRRARRAASPASAWSTACIGALAMMLPDKVKAAGDGGNTGISIGGYTKERKPFVYVEFTCGAWGARPWADGLNGNSHMFANQSCPSVEVIEAEQPVSVLAYEFVADKCGAGKYPRRRAVPAGLPVQRGRGPAFRALRQEDAPAVRALRRQPWRAIAEPPQPVRRELAAPLQGDDGHHQGRRVSAHASGRRRLGRSARARSGGGATRRQERVHLGCASRGRTMAL